MGQKLSARILTTLPTDGYVHIIRPTGGGGAYESYQISVPNLIIDVQNQIDALPAWQTPATGQTISAGNDTYDTGQATKEPTDWQILDSDGIDITSNLRIKTTLSGNWLLSFLSTPEAITGATINVYY